jgi:protein ImuA
MLELRGHSARLDLTATRRLHRRAQQAGRPVFLLRQSAAPEPTAAPVRLQVAAAPAAPRRTVAGAFARSIGPPGFTVTIGKSRTARSGDFILEWHPDARAFFERPNLASETVTPEQHIGAGAQLGPRNIGAENPGDLAALSPGRANPAPAAGALVAFAPIHPRAAGDQPAREERPAHRRPGRAG